MFPRPLQSKFRHPQALAWTCAASAVLLFAAGVRADTAAAAEPGVRAAWATPALLRATPAELETAYLKCERLAVTALLDLGGAADCSMVYEAFKTRVFDGDFRRLLAWSHKQQAAQPPAERPRLGD
jgi:hypothetical protein